MLVGLFGFYGFWAHGYVENTDAEITLHAARALYERGDPGLVGEGPQTWAFERELVARARGQAAAGRPVDYGMFGRGGKFYVWFPIGHQILLLPCVAAGEVLARWFPAAERAYLQRRGDVWGEQYWARALTSFVPALAAAGSTLMVLLLVLSLGLAGREALLVTAVATLCTQFWPGASETLSDAPGMFFLLAMAVLVFRMHAGRGGPSSALVAGVCGGWAVLVRYPHAIPVLVLAGVLALVAYRRKSWSILAALVLGAVPEAVVLLGANWLRFGSFLETGYSAGATPQFWSYPLWLGAPAMLLAPGKGLLWFSLPVWLALAALARAPVLRFPWGVVSLIFAAPLLVHGHSAGWAAGQCWGIRYMTPAIVLLVAVALACSRPWKSRPVLFAAICGMGFLVSVGGVLTPYRGQQELAYKAAAVVYADAPQLDNNVNSSPRFSPLHTHWIYAGLSWSGRLERGGAANTTGPLFGVQIDDEMARLTHPGEDAAFRHWWMPFLGHLLSVSMWPLAAAWLLATAAALVAALRRIAPRA